MTSRLAFLATLAFAIALVPVAVSRIGGGSAQAAPPVTPMIAAGNQHTCALDGSGAVTCWGRNEFGQLGNGTFSDTSNPTPVASLGLGVAAISAAGDFTCALTLAGGVKCWGYNGDGELGDYTQTNRSTPVDVIGLTSGVVAVSAGDMHACALLSGGTAKCWGYNYYGEVGNATNHSSWLGAVDVCSSGSGFACAGGSPLAGIASISAGGTHTCAVTTTHALKCWGNNFNGQLGLGVTPSKTNVDANIFDLPQDVPGLTSGIADVAAGGAETCVRTTGGGVKCWGYNAFGQAGDGTKSTSGPNYPQTTPVDVTGLASGVTAIAGGSSPCAVLSTSGLQCWGA